MKGTPRKPNSFGRSFEAPKMKFLIAFCSMLIFWFAEEQLSQDASRFFGVHAFSIPDSWNSLFNSFPLLEALEP